MREGFFSFESVLCFIAVFSLLLLASPYAARENSGLAKAQKLHDLMIVWASSECNPGEMVSDADFFLGKGNYSLWLAGVQVVSGMHYENFSDSAEAHCGPLNIQIALSA